MAGLCDHLAGDDPVPDGVELHRVGDRGDLEGDVERVVDFQNGVFGPIERMVDVTLRRLANPYVDMWFAEADGEVIGSGRLDRVPTPTSPASGAARSVRTGAAGASTRRSPRLEPARLSPLAQSTSTPTAR
jgi:hypothetical protein